MIRRISGSVCLITDQTVVIDVQGVGYLVHTPHTRHFTIDTPLSLHTHLAVRENALDLYGFELMDELVLFEQLLTLSKIGPKSALQILSQANLELIHTAVKNNDPSHLAKMSGLGKKTAEKVVAGLTEIYEKLGFVISNSSDTSTATNNQISDTIDALISLGYPEHDARKTVQQVAEADATLQNANDLLKQALRILGQS